jgi:hypothetical protein
VRVHGCSAGIIAVSLCNMIFAWCMIKSSPSMPERYEEEQEGGWMGR